MGEFNNGCWLPALQTIWYSLIRNLKEIFYYRFPSGWYGVPASLYIICCKDDVVLVDFNYFLTITRYFAVTASGHVTLAVRWD